ncbi:hypothetical protein ACIHEJ_35215 [Streptomyces sp. NPDC052301]|uniref:hypothetical protein n=1 Tax=Streptomyces sp. NPDC052301 TaxID=3365687 RepID=UPI0037CF3654
MPLSLSRTAPEAVAAACVCALLVVLEAGVVSRSGIGLAIVASGILAPMPAGLLWAYRAGRRWAACAL